MAVSPRPGTSGAAALVRYVQYFVKLRIYSLQISPLSHLARTADACRAHYSQFGSGSLRCGCGVETADKDRNLRGEYFCTRSMQLSLSGLQQ